MVIMGIVEGGDNLICFSLCPSLPKKEDIRALSFLGMDVGHDKIASKIGFPFSRFLFSCGVGIIGNQSLDI